MQTTTNQLVGLGALAATLPVLCATALGAVNVWAGFGLGACLGLGLGLAWANVARKQIGLSAAGFGVLLALLQVGFSAMGGLYIAESVRVVADALPTATPDSLTTAEGEVFRLEGGTVRTDLRGTYVFETTQNSAKIQAVKVAAPFVEAGWTQGSLVSAWVASSIRVETSLQDAETAAIEVLESTSPIVSRNRHSFGHAVADAERRHGLQQRDGAPVVEIYREPQADAWGVLGAAVIILLGGNFGYRRLAAGAHHAGAREG